MPKGLRVIFYGSHSTSFQPCWGSPRRFTCNTCLRLQLVAFFGAPSLRSVLRGTKTRHGTCSRGVEVSPLRLLISTCPCRTAAVLYLATPD